MEKIVEQLRRKFTENEIPIGDKINEFKKKYSPEELKSIINYIQDPVSKLIAEKLLLEKSE